MNDNSKSLFFLIISFGCFWLVLDEYYGNKYLSKIVSGLGIGSISVGDSIVNKGTDTAKDIMDNITDGKTTDSLQSGSDFIESNNKYKNLPTSLKQYINQFMTDKAPTNEGKKHALNEMFAHNNWSESDKLTARGALVDYWAKLASSTHNSSNGNTHGGSSGGF